MEEYIEFTFYKYRDCSKEKGEKCPYPRCVMCKTIIGNGVKFVCDRNDK